MDQATGSKETNEQPLSNTRPNSRKRCLKSTEPDDLSNIFVGKGRDENKQRRPRLGETHDTNLSSSREQDVLNGFETKQNEVLNGAIIGSSPMPESRSSSCGTHSNVAALSPSEHRSGVMPAKAPKIKRLRLEGIFHPKFENEISDQEVRAEMLSRIKNGEGHLEVTLKHSGSLLLWSGGNRYYSKNHTNNIITLVGELLLRQHMARLWGLADGKSSGKSIDGESHSDDCDGHATVHSTNSNSSATAESKYKECGDYLQKNRLTLAFEVVTSVLGDHAAVPKKPYLILLAVADRSREQFYGTQQLISFAHRFRLPHNDYWVFHTHSSALKLFQFYDDAREMGTTELVIKALDQLVDTRKRIVSMYPHEQYQGNILEGLVARFVPHSCKMKVATTEPVNTAGLTEKENSCPDKDDIDPLSSLDTLASVSEELLSINTNNANRENDGVDFQNEEKNQISVSDLRGILSKQPSKFFDAENHNLEKVEQSLRSFLKLHTLFKEDVQKFVRANAVDYEGKGWGVLPLVDHLAESHSQDGVVVDTGESDSKITDNGNDRTIFSMSHLTSFDEETKRIICLIQTLRANAIKVQYKLFREDITCDADGSVDKFGDLSNQSERVHQQQHSSRWICIIHIPHDSSFKKYNKQMTSQDMNLFRGFSFELIFDRSGNENFVNRLGESTLLKEGSDFRPANTAIEPPPLMLKMKFLPYMARTFGCRNGLKILSQSGVNAFEMHTLAFLKRWKISHSFTKKWQPYFYQWAIYAESVLKQQHRKREAGKDGFNLSTANTSKMRPLDESNYLNYLEIFDDLYKRGEIPKATGVPKSNIRGLIVIFSPSQKMSFLLSEYLDKKLGGVSERVSDITKVTEIKMHLSLLDNGSNGIICDVWAGNKMGTIRRLMQNKQFADATSIVLFGCGQDAINSQYPVGTRENKKMSGIIRAWRNIRCSHVLDLPDLSLFVKYPKNPTATGNDEESGDADNAQICDSEATRKLLKDLLQFSDSLPKQDHKPGALIFVPGIPGCGKSTILGSDESAQLNTKKRLGSLIKESTSYGGVRTPQQNQRSIRISQGDKVKERYWPLVLKELLQEPSSIYLADKNAAPSSWDMIADICNKTRTMPVPVLPDSMALSTVIVDAADSNNRQCWYPFSLQYLALCMLRVLERPGGSHPGKLDSKVADACMVVVKFYCLYRDITSEELVAKIRNKGIDVAIDRKPSPLIIQQVFDNKLWQQLPTELHDALMDALRLQFSIDCEKGGSKFKEKEIFSMESRLRTLLLTNRKILHSMCVSEDDSRESFITQISTFASSLDSCCTNSNDKQSTSFDRVGKFIEIASIDVDMRKIQTLLSKIATENSVVGDFLKGIGRVPPVSDDLENMKDKQLPCVDTNIIPGKFVKKTHVTMAHFSQLSQQRLNDEFKHLVGATIDINITGILFGEKIAAFSVIVPSETKDEKQQSSCTIPQSRNKFPHITIWFSNGENASKSNDLPGMVDRGEATQVILEKPVSIQGSFQYWFI